MLAMLAGYWCQTKTSGCYIFLRHSYTSVPFQRQVDEKISGHPTACISAVSERGLLGIQRSGHAGETGEPAFAAMDLCRLSEQTNRYTYTQI